MSASQLENVGAKERAGLSTSVKDFETFKSAFSLGELLESVDIKRYATSQLENYLKKHLTRFILLSIDNFIYYALTLSSLVYFLS